MESMREKNKSEMIFWTDEQWEELIYSVLKEFETEKALLAGLSQGPLESDLETPQVEKSQNPAPKF